MLICQYVVVVVVLKLFSFLSYNILAPMQNSVETSQSADSAFVTLANQSSGHV